MTRLVFLAAIVASTAFFPSCGSDTENSEVENIELLIGDWNIANSTSGCHELGAHSKKEFLEVAESGVSEMTSVFYKNSTVCATGAMAFTVKSHLQISEISAPDGDGKGTIDFDITSRTIEVVTGHAGVTGIANTWATDGVCGESDWVEGKQDIGSSLVCRKDDGVVAGLAGDHRVYATFKLDGDDLNIWTYEGDTLDGTSADKRLPLLESYSFNRMQ